MLVAAFRGFAAVSIVVLVSQWAHPAFARDNLRLDDKVKEGDHFIGRRAASFHAQEVEILEVLPNNRVKIRFVGLPEGFDQVQRKVDLERFIPIKTNDKLEVGQMVYYAKRGRRDHIDDVEIKEILPNGRIKVGYPGRNDNWDEIVPRSQLGWGDPRDREKAKGGGGGEGGGGGDGFRIWTDSTGKFKVEARFDSLAGDKVKLAKRDGKTVELPLDKLSDKDKKFIDNLGGDSSGGSDEDNPFSGK